MSRMKLDDLRGSLCYLATPYTHYKLGLEAAAYDAAEIAAKLMKRGLFIFAPIPHSHAIAKVGRLDKTDADFWEWADRPFVERSDALIVAMMEGWEDSRGVQHEVASFLIANKPVIYVEPDKL